MPIRSRILVGLAALCALLALLGTWVDRQLLDNSDWTNTSAALLRDDTIRTPLADQIAASIADGSRATEALQSALPPRLQPLAPEAGALVREAAQRATERLLAAPRIQRLWVDANRVTQQQLVDLVDGGGTVIAGRGVVLDLRPLARAIAQEAGFGGDRIDRLPAPANRVVILSPDQLDTLQQAGKLLNTLAWLPGLLAIALYGLAIWLAPSARRRTLLSAGASLAAAGLLVLIVRRVAGHEVVTAVAGNGALEPAASSVWRIATTLLAELALVAIVAGLFAVLGAWLAGPGRRASWLRARIAPGLVAQPGAAYGGAALAYLALVAWGPLSVLRRPLPIVIFGVLLAAGLVLLRAQTMRELEESRAMPGTTPAVAGDAAPPVAR